MGKFTAFKLPLKSLPKGRHEFQYHLGKQFFSDMENTDIRDAELDVALSVDYNGRCYLLDFRITGGLVLICDRCLDDLRHPLDATYRITVEYGDDYNDESDDVLQIPDSDSSLNVAYMIYDTVVLAIPPRHIHPAGKCNRQMSAILRKHNAAIQDEDDGFDEILLDGTDSTDGADSLNTGENDPRWEALRKLSDNPDYSDPAEQRIP